MKRNSAITIFLLLSVLLLIVVWISVRDTTKTDIEKRDWEMTEESDDASCPGTPDLSDVRKAIREHGDSLALEQYSANYSEYQPIDNDSLLYYSRLMLNKNSYNRAYIIMFGYWVDKYCEQKVYRGIDDATLIDSAMNNLKKGAEKGVKPCNALLAVLYANGIYFERDTILCNKCLIRAGCIPPVFVTREMEEDRYRREMLEIFMRDFSIDTDSLLIYSQMMLRNKPHSKAYYYLFRYWAYKYSEQRKKIGYVDDSMVDSAMTCLLKGAEGGDKSCNLLLSGIYANGLYFERDTSLSNECLIRAGYTPPVTNFRKAIEEKHRRKMLEVFIKNNSTICLDK